MQWFRASVPFNYWGHECTGLQVGQGTCQGVTYGGDFPTISANYKWLHSVFRPRAPQIRCSPLQAAQRAPSVAEEGMERDTRGMERDTEEGRERDTRRTFLASQDALEVMPVTEWSSDYFYWLCSVMIPSEDFTDVAQGSEEKWQKVIWWEKVILWGKSYWVEKKLSHDKSKISWSEEEYGLWYFAYGNFFLLQYSNCWVLKLYWHFLSQYHL